MLETLVSSTGWHTQAQGCSSSGQTFRCIGDTHATAKQHTATNTHTASRTAPMDSARAADDAQGLRSSSCGYAGIMFAATCCTGCSYSSR